MSLNDVWRKVNLEIGFHTKETFEKVPAVPGVYAWFYPLRVTTKNLDEFITEVATVQNYDSIIEDKPIKKQFVNFAWKKMSLEIELLSSNFDSQNFKKIWEEAVRNKDEFENLRRIIMKSSILMPPLYVGKTNNLYIRCSQHRNGNDNANNFSSRFRNFAKKNNMRVQEVSDLLFVCIKTIDEDRGEESFSVANLEGLVEEMLKNLCRPVYSKK